jgi:hypothetical protein
MPFTTDNYRAKVFVALCVAAFLGVLSRAVPIGFRLWDKYLGDVVYAAAFYLVVSFVWSTGTRFNKAALTAVYVTAIECFQVTPVPAQLKESDNWAVKLFAYIVLGSQFSWWDLLAYGVGMCAIICIDAQLKPNKGAQDKE